MSELADALRHGVETCSRALKGEMLPHEVNAWELWEVLSRASDRLSEPEEYLLYASLMRLIVATVRLQCRWLRYEADELYVDSDIAREKIASLPLRTLTSIFVKSLHPLVELEELSVKALEMGMEHWEELEQGREEDETAADGFLTFREGSEAQDAVVQEVRFQGLLDELEGQFLAESNGRGVPYMRFISRNGRAGYAEMVTRSYLGSFLISQGRLDLRVHGGGMQLVGVRSGPLEKGQSMAVVLKRHKERE